MSRDDVTTIEPDLEVDPDAEPDTDITPSRRRWRSRILVGLLAAVAISTSASLAVTLYQQSELKTLREQAITTARDYLVALAAFDYQHLDANKATITSQSTPDFARKYDDMVAALRDIVVTSEGVANATAAHVSVEQLDEHTATVVGFVDQHVTNVTAPQGNDQRYRMVVTLVRSDDRWVVDNVETV